MRRLLIGIGVALVAVVAGATIFAATFDADGYKPRIAEAVRRSTGRDLALNGKLSLSLLPLGLSARDVTFSNAPGGSRPEMATLDRLEASVAVWPLLSHRVEISRLIMVHPDILLERGADGRGNWEFAAEKKPPAAPSAAQTAKSTPWTVDVDGVEIDDGTLAWRGPDATRTLDVGRLTLRETADDAPISIDADAAYAGAAFKLAGAVGSLAGLRGDAPWPVDLQFASGGATLKLDGSLAAPVTGRGWSGKLDGAAPDLSALAPFLPGVALPPARDVRLSVQAADKGGALPDVSALSLHAGPADLRAYAPGLAIEAADISAERLDRPLKIDLRGSYAGGPLTVAALLGPPGDLLPGAHPTEPWPVDVSAAAAGATLSAKGRLGAGSGDGVAVAAKIPDLAALSALLRARLPALHDIAFAAHVADAPGGFSHGVALRGMTFVSPQADVSGDVTLGRPRPSVTGTVAASRLDLDAILAAFKEAPAPPQPAASEKASSTPAAPSEPRARRRFVIPDDALPLDSLRGADADIAMKIASMRTGGADYRNLDGRLSLTGGKLKLDPFSADLPAGHMEATLSLDASRAVPEAAVSVHAPQIAAKPMALLLGLPGDVSGAMDVDLELRGAGASPHAVASVADGHLGLAMVGGSLDKAAVGPLLGEILRAANFGMAGGGSTAIRCLAVRADIVHGLATMRALSLDTDQFALDGGGTVNLADEALSLRVHPLLRLRGAGVSVPLVVSGTLAAPRARIDVSPGAAAGEAESVGKAPFGLVIGALTGRNDAGDTCAASLAIARGGAAGPAPAPPPAAPAQKAEKPADILRQLFR
jgi:AsmA protein